MKKILFLSFIFLVSFSVSAQDFKKESSIAISFGPSFPVGSFADKDLYNEKAGLAAIGGFGSVSYAYQFSKFFGAIAGISARINGVDKNALQNYRLPTGGGATFGIEASTWRFFSLMGGIFQTVPITSNYKLTFEIKEMVGVQFSNSPKVTTSGFIPGIGSLNDVKESQSVSSLAYGLGLGLNYKMANKLKFKLFGEYQGAGPKFTYVDTSLIIPSVKQIKQETGTINVGLGLVFGF